MVQPLPKNRFNLDNPHVIDSPEGKQKAGIRLYKTLNWLSSLFIKTVKFQDVLLNFNSAKKYILRNKNILNLAVPRNEQSNLDQELVHLTSKKIVKYLGYLKAYTPHNPDPHPVQAILAQPKPTPQKPAETQQQIVEEPSLQPKELSLSPPAQLQISAPTPKPAENLPLEPNAETVTSTPTPTPVLDQKDERPVLNMDIDTVIPDTGPAAPTPNAETVTPTPTPAPDKKDERPVLNMETVTPGTGPFRVRKKPQPNPAPTPNAVKPETSQPAAIVIPPANAEVTLTRVPCMNILNDFRDVLGPDPKAGGSKSASVSCGMLEDQILMQTLRVNYYIANTGESIIVEEVNTPCTAIESTKFHPVRVLKNAEVKHIYELPVGVDAQVIEDLRNEHVPLWVKQFAQLQSNAKNNQPKLEDLTNTTGSIQE